MSITLSIIIPVYRTEKTLDRCVQSIVNQDFLDWEMLLIDDGSPDNSPSLCDNWAASDVRITAYHKTNGGLSDARNYGIEHARGRYIAFVDSDDEIAPHTFSKLMDIFQQHDNYDILEFPIVEKSGNTILKEYTPAEKHFSKATEWLSNDGLSHCWACNKIYKREVFSDVKFRKGRLYEDVLLVGDIIKLSPSIVTTNAGLYIYHQNSAGIVANRTNIIKLLEAHIEVINSLGIDTHELQWHRTYLDMLNIQLVAFRYSGKLLLHNQHISLSVARSMAENVKILLLNILGIKLLSRLYALFKA